MDKELAKVIDRAHADLAKSVAYDSKVYLSPSSKVIPFGLLLAQVLTKEGDRQPPHLCNNEHVGGAHLLVFSITCISIYYCRRAIINKEAVLLYTVGAYYGEEYNYTNNIQGVENMLSVLAKKVNWLHMKNHQYSN